MSLEQLYSMIEGLGFPVFLSIYLLLRFEKKIDSLNGTIEKLNKSISKLIEDTSHNKWMVLFFPDLTIIYWKNI